MILLEYKNKQLREENQRLKDKLKQEEKGITDPISIYVKKIFILSNEVKSQKANNSELKQKLNQLKNEVITLKFKKIQSERAKRHLLLYQSLSKNREVKAKSDTSSTDLEESLSKNNPHLPARVEKLKQKVRNQLDQIHALRLETNRLENREKDHQTLREEFDRLDRYVRRMTKNNGKVKKIR